MKDANARSEVFSALQSLSDEIPEMRAAQLIAAVGELCMDLHGRGLWDAEGDEFLEAIWRFRQGIDNAAAFQSRKNSDATAIP
jgi:hypothetical protein